MSHFPRSLPWPMSLIERDVLHELWVRAQATGKPITQIVKAAIDEHLTRALEQPALHVTESGISYVADNAVPEPLPSA